MHSTPYTPLTPEMIDDCPVVDIHVHAQGTIAPQTAWELGVRGGYIEVWKDKATGHWQWKDGPVSVGKSDPVGKYSGIFHSPGHEVISLDENGKPVALEYNYHCLSGTDDVFSGFDAVMATVQGHRHPPGGIRTEDDYRFVLLQYLESCKEQKVCYTELLQNIHIAHVLNPKLPPREARSRFYALCKGIVEEFAKQGVHLRFHHCPNKTSKSNLPGALAERSLEWHTWLLEAQADAPGVFVALNSAGHEEQEKADGGPAAMRAAYSMARSSGFGAEAHAGEGIGVEHMQNTMRELPVTRIAHGVQVVESQEAIDEVRSRDITLIMMPCINVALRSPIHVLETADGDVPHVKYHDGERNNAVKTKHISDLSAHPFFPLLRVHGLKIALATDNPGMGGKAYKEQVRLLAGMGCDFLPGFSPLSAEELAACNLHAIRAAFCEPEVKQELEKKLRAWMKRYRIKA
jgi:adenosine deaminase